MSPRPLHLGLALLALTPACLSFSGPPEPTNPCDPNPCTQQDKTTCAADQGKAICLCREGTQPRPNGTCEPVSAANCPEHPGDGFEPDDCIARASPLTLEKPREQTIEPLGDHDFFRIDATARDVYVLTVVAGPGALLPRVDVFDPEGKWLRTQEGTSRSQVGFKARATAPYTVRVSHSPRDPSPATGPYTLTLAAPVQDDLGDSSTEALAITPTPSGNPPTARSGRFEYGQDQDWFSFPVVRDAIYRIEFDARRTVPVTASYIRENVQSPFRTDQNSFVEFRAASSTTVFIALSPPNEGTGSYSFSVTEFR